jgi:hypothetical protein
MEKISPIRSLAHLDRRNSLGRELMLEFVPPFFPARCSILGQY